MPGGDRTGPLGKGPMTGRHLGNCANADIQPGVSRPRFYERRCGRGHGAAWAYRNQYHGGIEDKSEEIARSNSKIAALENQIEELKKTLASFGKKFSKQNGED